MTSTDQLIMQRLDEGGIRYSAGRRAVIRALSSAEGPRSAAELYEDLGQSVPLSSLYRSLAVLGESNVISQHHGIKGVTRYELAEWLTGHHHHLVCISCGTVDDITPPPALEADLQSVVASLTMEGGFSAKGHALEIEGICGDCE